MARTLREVNTWINAHVKDHVKSGHTHPHTHSENAAMAHDHPDLAKWPHSHEPAEPPHEPPPVEPPPVEPPPPVDLPPVEPPPPVTGIPAVQGWGLNWSQNLTATTPVTLFTSSSQFMSALSALGTTPRIIRPPTGLNLTVDLDGKLWRVDNRQNFLIDFRGANITIVNGCIRFGDCAFYGVVNPRDRSGWKGGQEGDNFTNAGSHDYAYLNFSLSGYSDEALSSSLGCARATYQDGLIGPGMSSGHNYASLNDVEGLSIIRTAFVGTKFRNPLVQGGKVDVVNAVRVDCEWGITVYGGHANDTNPYNQNVDNPTDVGNGKLSGLVVPEWARVAAMSPDAAARYAKVNAGALPHDSFDAGLVGRIDA